MTIGKLIPAIIGILAFGGWLYINGKPMQVRAYTPEIMTRRWIAISAYLGTLFGIALVVLFVAFWRRLSRETILRTVLNVITAWGLIALYFIASDPLAHPALEQIGLGEGYWIPLLGGIVWSVVSFYLFAQGVDTSARK